MTFAGVCTATVSSLTDPEGEGRVQVKYHMLPNAPKSAWAALAHPLAGGKRGVYFMPEIGDEALVAFDHGDFNHPFVLGFLWNGSDKPPVEGIDSNVRRIQSISGHQIDLDDRAATKSIVIKTAGGHTIELTDKPGNVHISISTPGGQKIQIADQPTPNITISAPTGNVKVECLQATVQASSMLQVSAPITTFSGVVQAQTVIATAVVSTSYSPGAGNML